tara:strand:+ start:1028 stop:1816 length:789 start_codon:yes stop_codon:yes gene_type:complete
MNKKVIRENHENDEVEKIMEELKLDPSLISQAKDVSPQEIENIINGAEEENALKTRPREYNEIGEKNSTVKDTQILNLGKNIKGGSSTRAYGWVRPSTVDKVDTNGSITKEFMSYKDNFPYNSDQMKMKSGDSEVLATATAVFDDKVFKQEAQLGTMILPANTSEFDIKNTFTERATSIYKTRIGYENKILPDVRKVDPDLLNKKTYNNTLYSVPDSIEIKTRPNLVGFKDRVEHMNVHHKLYPVNILNDDIKNITRNYNLK